MVVRRLSADNLLCHEEQFSYQENPLLVTYTNFNSSGKSPLKIAAFIKRDIGMHIPSEFL